MAAFALFDRLERLAEARDVGGVSEACSGETERTDDAVSMDDTDSALREVEGRGGEGCLLESVTVFRSPALCSFAACLRMIAELT